MKLNNIKKGMAAGIVVVIISAVAVFGLNAKKNSINENQTLSYIRTTTLSSGVIRESVSSTGTVGSANVSNVTTTLNYIVKSIEVQEGDLVEAGDVILILDTTELTNSIAKAEEVLRTQIEKAQSIYDSAYSELQQASNAKVSAEETLSSAKSELDSAYGSYQSVKNSISYYQNEYDIAYSAQEKLGIALNESETNYLKLLDESQVSGCEMIITESEITVESPTGNFDVQGNEIMETITEIVADEKKTELKNQCESKRVAYEQAKQEYEAAKIMTEQALQSLNNAKNQVNYSVYESEYVQKKSNVEKAEAALDQAEKSFESANENLNTALENLETSKKSDTLDELIEQKEECTLRAETSGTVTSINATVGSRINGTAAVIQDTEDLIISVTITEADINTVKNGMRVVITSDATESQIDGELMQLSSVASTQGMGSTSSTFSALVKVNGGSQGLKIGMNAMCEIVVSETEDVFSVPLDAIETDEEGKTYVYEKISGTGLEMEFERVEVIVGKTNDYYAEIGGENVYSGMVVRSSAVLEEAIAEGNENMQMSEFFGNMGNFNGGGNMPNGQNFPGGSMNPSGNRPSQGKGNFGNGQ